MVECLFGTWKGPAPQVEVIGGKKYLGLFYKPKRQERTSFMATLGFAVGQQKTRKHLPPHLKSFFHQPQRSSISYF
jgi:hypothetical protein